MMTLRFNAGSRTKEHVFRRRRKRRLGHRINGFDGAYDPESSLAVAFLNDRPDFGSLAYQVDLLPQHSVTACASSYIFTGEVILVEFVL